ncbi:hypothetical protein BH09PSE5_BH09PSE5_50190 [soil metagenome]
MEAGSGLIERQGERDDEPEAERKLVVEVVYCPVPGSIDEARIELPAGAVLKDALSASGVLSRHSELDPPGTPGDADRRCGIWGQLRPLDHVLRDGDRVEIYRPLNVDPMEARRRRQKVQRR